MKYPIPQALPLFILISATPALAQHGFLDAYNGASTCLQCHAGAAAEVMGTIHWTWEMTDSHTGKEVGKINVINNYCIAVPSNEPRCTSCHIGVGWADNTFDFSDSSQIDCLVCHDRTGTYKKVPTGAGAPDPSVDLLAVARSVGKPTRNNCGTCHFYGGGAEGVKLGTMDSSLLEPSAQIDVHMGGGDFACTRCHTPDSGNPHAVLGSRYSQAQADHVMCQDCHGAEPAGHSSILNSHSQRVACQTCHIPAMARGGKPTKTFWDWTTAGEKNPDGSDKTVVDENGYVVYQTKKGTFEWDENIIPEYRWFNGNVTHVTLEDPVMQGEVVVINQLHGDLEDSSARIFPVKRFRAIQPYDAGRNTLAIPNLFGSESEAFWKSYDWELALSSGMAYAGKPYTGPVGFIESEMYWIQNHMVAPADQALECADCHKAGSRMSFSQLGYAPERAKQLQLMMQSDYWLGFPVYPDGVTADAGGWLGWVDVTNDPWVYLYSLSRYAYVPAETATETGGWVYISRF